MALDFAKVLADLRQESDGLLAHLEGLPANQWEEATPAEGWAIRDQVSHLAYFDDAAGMALTDPAAYRRFADSLVSRGRGFPDLVAAQFRSLTPGELTEWFSSSRARVLEAFTDDNPRRRVPWFGPDMSVASCATARLMETWAHGHDVYDTLGVEHPPCPGLRSIAHLGVSTFAFAHRLHDRAVPDEAVRVELSPPGGGEVWTWGPADAVPRISGPAIDFVCVVTQRRHWTTTALVIEDGSSPVASEWLGIAQAYAGAPGPGRPARVIDAS
jgi:uncharacterized protein (TIGR03084 family)